MILNTDLIAVSVKKVELFKMIIKMFTYTQCLQTSGSADAIALRDLAESPYVNSFSLRAVNKN